MKPLLILALAMTGFLAFADPYSDLLNQYYDSRNGSSPDFHKSYAIDNKVGGTDLSSVDVPAGTYAWVENKLKNLNRSGALDYISSGDLPRSVYEKGPPAKWVSFLSSELKNPSEFRCTGFLGLGCSKEQQKGKALSPILGQVAVYAAKDKNMSSADKQKLKDALYPLYKDMNLKSDYLGYPLAPGEILQMAAGLGDPRAAEKALSMSQQFLTNKPYSLPFVRDVDGNFQQSMFALETYYKKHNEDHSSPDDPTYTQVVSSLRQILASDTVPDFMKRKLSESLSNDSGSNHGSDVLQSTTSH